MKLFLFYSLVTSFFLKLVIALNPIVIKGHKFFDAITKDQFFIKGVAYQPRTGVNSLDPLADPNACARDAELMKKLGLNVIRVYQVDPTKDHTECMNLFAEAGIYLMLDIASPQNCINRETPEYTLQLFNGYKATVDAFHDYDNMIAYIAGNEVTNDKKNTLASAYVKAAVRDIKAYIKSTKTKYIPVGYASNDDEYVRDPIKDYFACGPEDEQVSFFF
ncbi:Glucanosyltransferase, partial [Cunninghamella echinulata]